MQDFDIDTEIPLGLNRELLTEQRQSGVSNLLADAYGWASDNKLAATAGVGAAAVGAFALLRGGIGNVAKAVSSDALSTGQKFIVQDASVLGGRIGVNASERYSPRVAAAIAEGRPIVGTSLANIEAIVANGQRAAINGRGSATEFIVVEGGEFGGRIISKPVARAAAEDVTVMGRRTMTDAGDAFAMGQRALAAPLHEIPTFALTLRADVLPKSAVRVIDNFEAKTGLKLLGK